jgi:mono/diheme cytochrome c family protein
MPALRCFLPNAPQDAPLFEMRFPMVSPYAVSGFGPFALAASLLALPVHAAEEDSAQESGSPMETPKPAEKGALKNPYSSDDAAVVEEGHEIYMAAGCNGCHGGTGGGGMGPPLTNPVWIYGKDDDTLFRLTALGTDALLEQGYTRTGSENVVGPMPAQGTIVKSTDDMWKMITWIRSINE